MSAPEERGGWALWCRKGPISPGTFFAAMPVCGAGAVGAVPAGFLASFPCLPFLTQLTLPPPPPQQARGFRSGNLCEPAFPG